MSAPESSVTGYALEFSQAWDRTLRFGLKLSPLRLLVRKDCIDVKKATAVIIEYFDQHAPEELMGQIMASYNVLQGRLMRELGVPLYFTIGWFDLDGQATLRHGDERIQEYLDEKLAAWQRNSVAFHFWLTSPALEVIDATFALNLGRAQTAAECGQLVVYQSSHSPLGPRVYHPTLVGDDFLVRTGAAL